MVQKEKAVWLPSLWPLDQESSMPHQFWTDSKLSKRCVLRRSTWLLLTPSQCQTWLWAFPCRWLLWFSCHPHNITANCHHISALFFLIQIFELWIDFSGGGGRQILYFFCHTLKTFAKNLNTAPFFNSLLFFWMTWSLGRSLFCPFSFSKIFF